MYYFFHKLFLMQFPTKNIPDLLVFFIVSMLQIGNESVPLQRSETQSDKQCNLFITKLVGVCNPDRNFEHCSDIQNVRDRVINLVTLRNNLLTINNIRLNIIRGNHYRVPPYGLRVAFDIELNRFCTHYSKGDVHRNNYDNSRPIHTFPNNVGCHDMS